MTDQELEEVFNINERFEELFSNHVQIEGFQNFTSIKQDDETGPRIIFQNIITGATDEEAELDGEMEQVGITCDLLVSVILDRQDNDIPDFHRIHNIVSKVRVRFLRSRVKSIVFPCEYFVGASSFVFGGIGHDVNDKNQDIITLKFSYPVYVQFQTV
jgi:hypothetical protein